jgi:hypothetical protein
MAPDASFRRILQEETLAKRPIDVITVRLILNRHHYRKKAARMATWRRAGGMPTFRE